MADIAASNVTYTINKVVIGEDGRRHVKATVAFGNGALTYPTGGVPLTKGKLGLPYVVDQLNIVDTGTTGFVWRWDAANNKLMCFTSAAVSTHAHDLLIKGGQAASTTNNTAHYATDIFGKEAATDATIAGSASATKGGVILGGAVAAAALAQHANAAIAAQSLIIEAIGH